jgi:S1-C subfamily serine protease
MSSIDEAAALDAYSQAINTAAERVGPAVVKIETGRGGRRPDGRRGAQQGLGSGVIYSSDGHILTNAHVVAGASRVLVSLPDGRRLPAGVLGSEPANDLAVLRVAESGLPVAHLSAAPLRIGQLVIAIGNPFGFDFTVTAGVISALNRSLPTGPGQQLEQLIQTDTPINPGNSGGPLADVLGRVVGITTAIVPWGQGLGFVVPTATAYAVIARITEAHRSAISRGALGISGLDTALDDTTARENGADQRTGVLLLEVAPNSPAEQASLRSGDILLGIEEHRVETVDALRKAVQALRGRSPWRVSFLREGRRRSVSLQPKKNEK